MGHLNSVCPYVSEPWSCWCEGTTLQLIFSQEWHKTPRNLHFGDIVMVYKQHLMKKECWLSNKKKAMRAWIDLSEHVPQATGPLITRLWPEPAQREGRLNWKEDANTHTADTP